MKHITNTTLGLGVVVITLVVGVIGPWALGIEVVGLGLWVLACRHRRPTDD